MFLRPACIADRMDMLLSSLDDNATLISGNSSKRGHQVFDVTIFGIDFISGLLLNHLTPHVQNAD